MTKKRSLIIFIVFGILSLVMFFWATSLDISVSTEDLLSEYSEALGNMEKLQNKFGYASQFLLIIKTDGIFDRDTSVQIYNFLEKLRTVEGVEGFNSIFDAAKLSVSGGLSTKPYFVNGIPEENAEELLENKLYISNLIDSTGKTIFIPVDVNDMKVVAPIMELVKAELSEFETYATGEPVLQREMDKSVLTLALIYPPILFGLIWFIYFLRLGSGVAAILPPIIAVLSALWTYGVAGLIGYDINILTSTMGLFIIVISSSYGLHFIDRYITNRQALDHMAAVKKTVREEIAPISLSALTTAVGFLTFIFSTMKAFKQLGLLVSIGIILSGVFSLILMPAITSFIDVHTKRKRYGFAFFKGKKSVKFDLIATIVMLVLIATSPFLLGKITVNFDQFAYFKDNSEIKKSADVAKEEFGWILPFYVVLEKNGVFTASDENNIKEVVNKLKGLERVNGVSSILDISEAYGVPLPLLQILSRNSDLSLEQFLVEDSTRILVKTPYTDASNSEKLKNSIKEVLENYQQYNPYIAASALITSDMNSEITINQIGTILAAIAAIFILLLIVFRSLKDSFISIIPTVMAIVFNFLYMFLFGIELDISTAIIAGILLGLIIDYSIHIMSRYRTTGDIEKARMEVAPVIISNTLALSVGFGTLLFAPLLLFVKLGGLLAIGMLTGAFLTLTVLPTIIRLKTKMEAKSALKKEKK